MWSGFTTYCLRRLDQLSAMLFPYIVLFLVLLERTDYTQNNNMLCILYRFVTVLPHYFQVSNGNDLLLYDFNDNCQCNQFIPFSIKKSTIIQHYYYSSLHREELCYDQPCNMHHLYHCDDFILIHMYLLNDFCSIPLNPSCIPHNS